MTETSQPPPPQNLEAEEHVLGAIMISPAAIEAVRPILDPRDFYRETHARIYRAALDLHSRGEAVDAILVADELDRTGQLEAVGGKDRIREIATLVPATSNAAHYAERVVEMAELRALITVGQQIAQLGWERGADSTHLLDQARAHVGALDERRRRTELTTETWHQFEAQAHDHIPVLVDRLWPEAAFGFVAAPPKKGKTWIALALSIAVATGKPLFDHFTIPAARPVLYVALEGHRAALRARVGAIARGMGLNPDSDELDHLHWLYKPRGINLADPAWAQQLRQAATGIDAALITIDVLRASARIKENDQAEFTALRASLQPITDDGRSIAMLHHNVKLSEISKERDAGERMSGSGAMYGALDTAIYITGSENHATKLRLEFDIRDLATPDHINVELTGDGTGENGGYTYRDTATWVITANEVGDDDLRAPATEILAFIHAQGGQATGGEIRAHFEQDDKLLSSDTLAARVPALERLGVTVERRRGNRGNLYSTPKSIAGSPSIANLQYGLDLQYEPHNKATQLFTAGLSQVHPTSNTESGDLQGESIAGKAAPYGSAPTPARAGAPVRAREAQPAANGSASPDAPAGKRARDLAEVWLREEWDRFDDPADELMTRWPLLAHADLHRLLTLGAELARG